jgi:predicted Zn-dependent protease
MKTSAWDWTLHLKRGKIFAMLRNRLVLPNIIWFLILILLASFSSPPAVPAMTIQEERELGDKFLLEVKKRWPFIRDVSINAYVNDIGKKILEGVGPQPFEYQFFVLNSPEINAFAVPGGKVFVNSGLILLVEKEDELAGVIAHEIGHVAARHISKRSEKATPLSLATLGALLLGIFLGGKAASAVTATTIAATETVMLKYSRDDEEEADRLALKYLEKTGYDRKALVSMFKKIRRAYGPASSDPPAYLMTHPAAEERAEKLDIQMSQLPPSEAFLADPIGNIKRVQTKLRGEENNPPRIVAYFEDWLKRQPNEGEAYFGLGLAHRRMGSLDRAIENMNQALSLSPRDGEILRELGNTHFLKGDFPQAQKYLEEASRLNPKDGMTYLYLGLVYFEQNTAQPSLLAFLRAKELLLDYPEIYYHLGRAYGKVGQLGPAYQSFGQYHKTMGDLRIAVSHFQKALSYYDEKSPERRAIQKEINDLESSRREPR